MTRIRFERPHPVCVRVLLPHTRSSARGERYPRLDSEPRRLSRTLKHSATGALAQPRPHGVVPVTTLTQVGGSTQVRGAVRGSALPPGVIVDEVDRACLPRYSWRIGNRGYVIARVPKSNRDVLLHRLILNAPIGVEVDHIDRNKLNNSRSNLRLVDRDTNMQNRGAISRSGYRGVTFEKRGGYWRVEVRISGIRYRNFGKFASAEDAHKVASEFRRAHMPGAVEVTP